MERRQMMSPQEFAECRRLFEKLDASGHKDISYSDTTRRYLCPFMQGKWLNWQNAWREGQRYLKEGPRSTEIETKIEAPQETSSAPKRIMRVSRTPQG